MSNTTIQIKRSSGTIVPANGSLSAGELAYSYLSDKLFIGDATGTGVLAIGGKHFVDLLNLSFDVANAAYAAANAAATSAKVNLAFDTANAAFDKANSANVFAYNTDIKASAGFDKANSANVFAYNTDIKAAAAFDKANSANVLAKAAYDDSNTRVSKSGDTITGDLSVVGNLSVSGQTSYINVENYRVDDSLIYLAANNYVSDIVDIGFIANYVNATGSNVHTGIFREHSNKEYYVFQGYDQEPLNNHIDPNGNNFTLAVLNADIRTSNLNLGGANAILWITGAFDKANSVAVSANAYANVVGSSSNAYADVVGASSNAYANVVGASANSYANVVGSSANAYADVVGASSNAYANVVGAAANTYADGVGSAANTNAANATYLTVGTVPSGRISGSYSGITGVGTLTSGTWNADIITVPYGGTGRSSFTTNGVLFGNSAGPISITSAGTEGQVLQASSTGVPQFAMLDGGSF